MTSQFSDRRHRQFFWRCFVSLVKFSYWSKFHVNIITGSGVMTIFFYKGLTRNPEIGNTPVWVLPNIWRLGRVRNTKFGTNVSNKMLLNAAKCQGCSFYRCWVITGKPTVGRKIRYYATFKVRKFEWFYKVNAFLQKTTTCMGLQAEQIFSVHI